MEVFCEDITTGYGIRGGSSTSLPLVLVGRSLARPTPHCARLSACHPLLSFPYGSMSSRHSFLSTTGLIRPGSALSMNEGSILPPPNVRPSTAHRGRKPASATAPSKPLTTRAGILPLSPGFLVFLAAILSILFVSCLSFAFIPDEDEKSPFADDLDYVAANAPGVSTWLLTASGHNCLTSVPRSSSSATMSTSTSTSLRLPSGGLSLVAGRRTSCLALREPTVAKPADCRRRLYRSSSTGKRYPRCGATRDSLRLRALEPVASYDPAILPIFSGSGKRHRCGTPRSHLERY